MPTCFFSRDFSFNGYLLSDLQYSLSPPQQGHLTSQYTANNVKSNSVFILMSIFCDSPTSRARAKFASALNCLLKQYNDEERGEL